MACLIEFKTSMFDPAAEPPNRINPIAGQSVLKWLREHVVPDATEPDGEDWGWYMEVDFDGARYLVGAICHPPEQGSPDPIREWMIQIHKQRSLKDKLFGRTVLQPTYRLAAKFVGAFRADPAFLHIQQTTER